MNVAEIVMIVICVSLVYDGYRSGFVHTIFTIVRTMIGIIIAAVVCSMFLGKMPSELRYIVPFAFMSLVGIVFGILGAIERTLNLVKKIPIAKQMNKLAGIVAGLLHSIIFVWITFCITGYFADTSWGEKVYVMLNESEWLLFINMWNPVWYVVTDWWNQFSITKYELTNQMMSLYNSD